ncbi:MAG: chemotaxis protein CheA, partial [Planctomycetota bacterium]
MHDDQGLLDEFTAEAREHLESVESQLLELEQQGAAADDELVNVLFRSIHSIKGGAGFLGLTAIQGLAHVMEALLDRMREHDVVPTSANVNTLLRGADALQQMIDGTTFAEEQLNLIITAIEEHSTDQAQDLTTHDSLYLRPSDGGDIITISPDPMAPAEHSFRFLLTLAAGDSTSTKADLLNEMMSTSTILHDGLTDEGIGSLVIASMLDDGLIADFYGLSKHCIHPLEAVTAAEAASTTKPPAQPEPTTAPKPATPEGGASGPVSGEAPRKQLVRVNLPLLDRIMDLTGELVLVRNRQLQSLDDHPDADIFRKLIGQLNTVTNDLQDAVMRTRMQEVGSQFAKAPRMVRDLCQKLGKQIRLETIGNDVELDKTILEGLADPLTHIVRNACDHGIEMPEARIEAGKDPEGCIRIVARHEAGHIVIVISDDGGGLDRSRIIAKALDKDIITPDQAEALSDHEAYSLVMAPGFSTAETVTDVSGRGVGMDVVRSSIEHLGGSIELDSVPGRGTTLTLRVPLTLAIISSLIVRQDGRRFAVPQVNIE